MPHPLDFSTVNPQDCPQEVDFRDIDAAKLAQLVTNFVQKHLRAPRTRELRHLVAASTVSDEKEE